ncbi:carbohydrate sulfotransferase 1-like [Anneissia japonica]|uniref:carbohydrate sulfotransferase 1-like n=1 Tax=Anneissia japonica TaxID=1529436 RepID=UPI001425777C|nr:carbohydrate sulfotransferase 1-like [Anneissia japonica]
MTSESQLGNYAFWQSFQVSVVILDSNMHSFKKKLCLLVFIAALVVFVNLCSSILGKHTIGLNSTRTITVSTGVRKVMASTCCRQYKHASSFNMFSIGKGSRGFDKNSLDAGCICEQQRPTKIMILASMRTGSSFLGRLFAENNDVFYLYEPGRRVMVYLRRENITSNLIEGKLLDIIWNTFQCSFADMDFYIKTLSRLPIHPRRVEIPATVNNRICEGYNGSIGDFLRCQPVTRDLLENVCNTKKYVVIKTIRISNLNLLRPLVKEHNLKVVHLIRDPRGVISSRMLLVPTVRKRMKQEQRIVFNVTDLTSDMKTNIRTYCSDWLKNLEIGHHMALFSDNYFAIRYEDVAIKTSEKIREIYTNLGIKIIPYKVKQWIKENTHFSRPTGRMSWLFSTQRNSSANAESWRTKMTMQLVEYIQNVTNCEKLMRIAGYKKVLSQADLTDSSKTFIGEQTTKEH